uniref:Retrovirus-related Pol polyprotein from transposon TNT 1-94 n=1 Tax=Cajanus cajan TaxID=3821 RepID=A0A151TBX4_CAJCA|nr:hypothetical protein KK1_019160 [Cajanus cajan]
MTSTSPFARQTFNMPITIKLDNDNFLIWQQQVLATIQGLKLESFVHGNKIPPCYANKEDEIVKKENPKYTNYVQQDQLLVVWLLTSMSSPILTKMVGLNSINHIWKRLEVYYATHTRAVIKKLGINEYLLEVKKIVDSLAVVGSSIIEVAIGTIETGLTWVEAMDDQIGLKLAKTIGIKPIIHGIKDLLVRFVEKLAMYNQEYLSNPQARSTQFQSYGHDFSNITILTTLSIVIDSLWYLNSSASHHITHDESNLSLKNAYTRVDFVNISNGTGLHIKHVGHSYFRNPMSS